MAAGLFSKGRLVVLGNAHDLLNRLIDANSPSALRQYVRDIETQLMTLQTEVAAQDGQLRIMRREQADLTSRASRTEGTVKAILAGTDGNKEAIAKQQAGILLGLKQQSELKVVSIATQQGTVDSLTSAVTQLRAKHDEILNRIKQLEQLDRDSKAKEHAVAAVRTVNQLMGDATSFSVDDIQARMKDRNDLASAAFDREVGGLADAAHSQVTEENATAVDDLLNSLRPVSKETPVTA